LKKAYFDQAAENLKLAKEYKIEQDLIEQ